MGTIKEFCKRGVKSIGIGLLILLTATITALIACGVGWVIFILPIKIMTLFFSEPVAAIIWFIFIMVSVLVGHLILDKYNPIRMWFRWQFIEPFKKEK